MSAVKKVNSNSLPFVKDLDTPLLRLSPFDVFTLRDACGGVHVFGQIGSGKTSATGKMLAGAYLRAGMGGIVTVVKHEEIELFQRYAAEHGRSRSLILFDENESYSFLSHELARQGVNGIGSLVECLLAVIEAAKRASPMASQQGGDTFWIDETRVVLRRTILPLYAANGSVSVPEIIRFITSAPQSLGDVTSRAWRESSFLFEVMQRAKENPKVPVSAAEIEDTILFWRSEWLAIPEKTRGNIVVSVTGVLDRFRYGRLQRAFCGKTTTLVPEMTFLGSVILLAMPTLTWNADGIIAQQLFKYMWQRAVLSRNSLAPQYRERPVFSYSDENQDTVSSHDGEFLSKSRGSRCCVVCLTQSLPNYYSKMGGDDPHDDAHTLVGKFTTCVYHANSCPDTNEHASRTIGKVIKLRRNTSTGTSTGTTTGISQGSSENNGSSSSNGHSSGTTSSGPSNHGVNSSSSHTSGTGKNWGTSRGRSTGETTGEGFTETLENAIEPGDFGKILKVGGPANNNQVTGVWFQGGRIFKASGTNMLLGTFNQ